MRDAFRYPLSEDVLHAFTHPDPAHPLHRPHRYRDAVLAVNGYVAILCHRGLWLDTDFAPAPPSLLSRADKYDWSAPASIPAHQWTDFDKLSHTIRQAHPPGLWLGHRRAPSPLWLIGPTRISLALLGLIARIPRAELSLQGGATTYFRFSGGLGLIPRDPRLATLDPSRVLHQTPTPII